MNKILFVLCVMLTFIHASSWKHFSDSNTKVGSKLMLIKVMQDDCQYCCYMNTKVFNDNAVMKVLSSKFSLYTVNISHENMPFNIKNDVVPSFYILDEKHTVLKRIRGAWSKEDFLDFLAPFLKDK